MKLRGKQPSAAWQWRLQEVLSVLFGTLPASLSFGKEEAFTFNFSGEGRNSAAVVHAGKSIGGLDLERTNDLAIIFCDDPTTGLPRCITYVNTRHK